MTPPTSGTLVTYWLMVTRKMKRKSSLLWRLYRSCGAGGSTGFVVLGVAWLHRVCRVGRQCRVGEDGPSSRTALISTLP